MGILEDRARLEGKVAIVIGGGAGLGQAVALDLAQAGVRIAVCDIDPEALAATAEALDQSGKLLLAQVLDATEPDAIAGFYDAFDRVSDRLDILVNVAGGTRFSMFVDSDPGDWQRDARWNFEYVLHSSQHAVRRMRGKGGGSIVNITTIEAHRAAPGYAVYAGYKAGLANFSRSLAVELGGEGIRVNSVAVESVPTQSQVKIRSNFNWSDPSRAEELTKAGFAMYVPLCRSGVPQELSNAVMFLASDLSSFITGTALHVDGGAYSSSGWMRWPGDDWHFPRPSPAALERLFPAENGG